VWSVQWWICIAIAAGLVLWTGDRILCLHFGWHFPVRTAGRVLVAVASGAAILGFDYWYYSNYSLNGGFWHLSIGMQRDAGMQRDPVEDALNTRPQPNSEPIPLSLPIMSRLERFIFACNVPAMQGPDQEATQKETLKKNVQTWADTIAVVVTFDDISGGLRITAEAKTVEAKARFVSLGLLPGITKVILETRGIGQQQLVAAYAEIPKKMFMIYGLVPDPHHPQVIAAQNLLGQFMGGACHLV
jgi:hypothetical protein